MNQYIINEKSTLLEALNRLNELSGKQMVLLVVDANGVMTGTLTDGDVRRALLGGVSLSSAVEEAMHRNFKAIRTEEVDVQLMRSCRLRGVGILPHLNADGTIKNIYDLTVTKAVLPMSAILMAGGKGERLRPLTLNTPKPLLEIGGKAIIDYNIEALASVGITDITVTTRYLADQIHQHFATPVAGVNVTCVTET